MVYKGVLVFLGLIVCLTCQESKDNTYVCNTGDECQRHNSRVSIINGIIYCCNNSDSMNLGHMVVAGSNVLLGKRNNVTAHFSDLQCQCTVIDEEKLHQIQSHIMESVSQSLSDIDKSVSETLNNLEHLFGNLKK